MYLETGRTLVQGGMLLVFAAITYWVSLTAGLVLIAFMGVMRIQQRRTDWCPCDVVLRPMGLKKKSEVLGS